MLTAHDAFLASKVDFIFKNKGLQFVREGRGGGWRISFQFPPHILSDSRKGNWVEGPLRGDEPVAVFANSGPREITMSWTYIVGARGWDNTILYTPSTVAAHCRALRSYFSQTSAQSVTIDDALVLYFRAWYHTGVEYFSCRILSLDITHKGPIISDYGPWSSKTEENNMGKVAPASGPDPTSASRSFALRTDITAELRLWTKVGASAPATAEDIKNIKPNVQQAQQSQEEKVLLKGLSTIVTAEWQ